EIHRLLGLGEVGGYGRRGTDAQALGRCHGAAASPLHRAAEAKADPRRVSLSFFDQAATVLHQGRIMSRPHTGGAGAGGRGSRGESKLGLKDWLECCWRWLRDGVQWAFALDHPLLPPGSLLRRRWTRPWVEELEPRRLLAWTPLGPAP